MWGVLCASLVVVLTLGGCAGSAVPGAATPTATTATTPEATATPEATPTPTVTEPASRNNLTGDQIVAMATACGGSGGGGSGRPGHAAAGSFAVGGGRARILHIDGCSAARSREWSRAMRRGPIADGHRLLIAPATDRSALPGRHGGLVLGALRRRSYLRQPRPPAGVRQWAVPAHRCSSPAPMRGRAVRPTRRIERRASVRPTTPCAAHRARGDDRTVLLRNGLTLTVTQPEGDSRISHSVPSAGRRWRERRRLSSAPVGRASTSSSSATCRCSTRSTPTRR